MKHAQFYEGFNWPWQPVSLAMSSSMAAEWFVVPELSSEKMVILFDKESYTRNANKVNIWLRSELSENLSKELNGIVTGMNQTQFDCAKKTITTRHIVVYKKDGVSESTAVTPEEQPAVPGTRSEFQIKTFCNPNLMREVESRFLPVGDGTPEEAAKAMFLMIEDEKRKTAQ